MSVAHGSARWEFECQQRSLTPAPTGRVRFSSLLRWSMGSRRRSSCWGRSSTGCAICCPTWRYRSHLDDLFADWARWQPALMAAVRDGRDRPRRLSRSGGWCRSSDQARLRGGQLPRPSCGRWAPRTCPTRLLLPEASDTGLGLVRESREPADRGEEVDWEAELAVVIGARLHRGTGERSRTRSPATRSTTTCQRGTGAAGTRSRGSTGC